VSLPRIDFSQIARSLKFSVVLLPDVSKTLRELSPNDPLSVTSVSKPETVSSSFLRSFPPLELNGFSSSGHSNRYLERLQLARSIFYREVPQIGRRSFREEMARARRQSIPAGRRQQSRQLGNWKLSHRYCLARELYPFDGLDLRLPTNLLEADARLLCDHFSGPLHKLVKRRLGKSVTTFPGFSW